MPAAARDLHPLAWWAWAVGTAVAASTTTDPLVLVLLLAAIWIVVELRRGGSPWAGAFRLYVWLGVAIVALRVVFHVLVGYKYGDHVLLRLPTVPLPGWAAGIQVGGDVGLEGLLSAVVLGLRLAVLVIAVGAANALADPKRMLRSLPRALHELGTAVVVAVSVAPQLAESVQRVLRARRLRGDTTRGVRVLPRVALPVLQDTLDRSLLLAAAMESRGYGGGRDRQRPWWQPALTLGGLVVICLGLYQVLDPTVPVRFVGYPVLLAGAAATALGLALAGAGVRVTTYRPAPWRTPETLTVLCGLGAAAAMLLARALDAAALDLQTQPLAPPTLPPLTIVAGLLVALPAVLTPRPAAPVRATAVRR